MPVTRQPARGALLLLMLAGCAAGGNTAPNSTVRTSEDTTATSTTDAVAATEAASTIAAPTTTETTPAPTTTTPAFELTAFPPPALPLLPASAIEVGREVVSLRHGGTWMFAVRPPATLLRIFVATGEIAELDMALGESRAGAIQHVYADDRVWVVGGPFRDTLVEVDPATMTEVRRITLDDDHGIGQAQPGANLWLSTLRAVRPIDTVTGEIGERVALEVDPAALVADGDHVWVSLPAAAQIARLDVTTGDVELIDTEPGPAGLALHGDTLWSAHPPTATVSRIDTTTGEVIGVIDVDVAVGDVAASNVPGIRATADGIWVFVRFDGSPFAPVLVRLDVDSGAIIGARTVQIDAPTWDARDGEIWLHHRDSASLVGIDVDGFSDAPPTALDVITPSTDPTDETDGGTDGTLSPDAAVTSAFERFVDRDVPSQELDLGELADVRTELLELLTAQAGGEARLLDVVVDGDRAVATFDVVVEGDTVLIPGIELVFEHMTIRYGWTVAPDSLCTLASGVGIECP